MKSRLSGGLVVAGVLIAASLGLGVAPPAKGRVMIARPVQGGAGGDVPEGTTGKGGLHLPRERRINFTYEMQDGGGYRWDIGYYGHVGSGTNSAYGSGLYPYYNGSSYGSNSTGYINADGDEVETSPVQIGNSVRASRRIKVYKDQPLARWLEVFENTSGQEQTVQFRIQTNTNWTISSTETNSGESSFGDKDFAFVTQVNTGGGANPPVLLHIVCDAKTKNRPTVNAQGNYVNVNYVVTVPANGVAVICHFQSQNNSIDDHKKLMKSFRPYRYLKDLDGTVRKLIQNMALLGGFAGVELERSDFADVVIQANGEPIYGTVRNAEFVMNTFYGQMKLPAQDVVGMAAGAAEDEPFRAALVDGQIVCGCVGDAKLQLELPAGGTLSIPFDRIAQWSYRINKQRPDEVTLKDPLLVLRTGDQLAFAPSSLKLALRTAHGMVQIEGKDLLEISLDNGGNAVHRVTFVNGSTLAGFLEPRQIDLQVKLGPRLEIPRDLLMRIRFAAEEAANPVLSQVTLSNGDLLLGELAEPKLNIVTDYGPIDIAPDSIRSLTFLPTQLNRIALETWDNSVIRGQLQQQELAWQIVPGPKVRISTSQFSRIVRSQSVPPGELRGQVEKLVAKLGAESYLDRQAATEALLGLGKSIVPLLRTYLKDADPEVRQRVGDIIEKLGGDRTPPEAAEAARRPGAMIVDMVQE